MSKNKKITIEKLAEMVAGGFEKTATKNDIANMATKDDTKGLATKMDLENVERRLSAKIDAVEDKVDNLEMVDVLDLRGRVSVLEKDVKQIKHRHV